MAVRGQTHAKRERELARKERRERKQAKKDAQRAAASTDMANGADNPQGTGEDGQEQAE